MDKELVKGALGAEGSYEVDIAASVLVVKGGYMGADMGVELALKIPLKPLLEKLKAAIPGTIDDYLISVAEAAAGL